MLVLCYVNNMRNYLKINTLGFLAKPSLFTWYEHLRFDRCLFLQGKCIASYIEEWLEFPLLMQEWLHDKQPVATVTSTIHATRNIQNG